MSLDDITKMEPKNTEMAINKRNFLTREDSGKRLS
jgi:hypothetical protein